MVWFEGDVFFNDIDLFLGDKEAGGPLSGKRLLLAVVSAWSVCFALFKTALGIWFDDVFVVLAFLPLSSVSLFCRCLVVGGEYSGEYFVFSFLESAAKVSAEIVWFGSWSIAGLYARSCPCWWALSCTYTACIGGREQLGDRVSLPVVGLTTAVRGYAYLGPMDGCLKRGQKLSWSTCAADVLLGQL